MWLFHRMRASIQSTALAAVLAVVGCASHGTSMRPALNALSSGDYERAAAELERRPQPESVVWRMEYGLLLRYAGRLAESNESFAEALRIQEERYTRSITTEAAALAVSDAIRPYRAADFELGFLHAYPALNYLEMGNLDGALVEARALSQMLEQRSARSRGDEGEAPGDWALGRHLTALIYEAGREWNNAWIAYRAALRLYRASPPRGWDAIEPDLLEAVLRTGAAIGLRVPDDLYGADPERAGHLRARLETHGDPGGAEGVRAGRSARLVVWQEEGLVPIKEDFHIRVPILKSEENWNRDHMDAWAPRVGERTLAVHSGSYSAPRAEIAYFLDVALPVMPQPRPLPPLKGTIRVNGDHAGYVFEAGDIEEAARDDLRQRFPTIAARAAARAILKALATRGARKEGGELAGILANVLGVATERADTRGWSTLPSRIGLTVVEVEPGPLRIEVESAALGGRASTDAEITGSGWHFFSYRFF